MAPMVRRIAFGVLLAALVTIAGLSPVLGLWRGVAAPDKVWGLSASLAMALLLPVAVPWVIRARLAAAAAAREARVRRAVEAERLNIAREVHDIVGHGLAVISLQSGVAVHVAGQRPEQVQAALEVVNRVSRETLAELDAVFGVFRESRDGVPFDLMRLIETMRSVGLRIDLQVAGAAGRLSAKTQLALYRLLQEALTNVLRHAGTDAATIEIQYGPDEVVLRIADIGKAGEGHGGGAEGRGIAGMRERVEALGGTLEAAPRADVGFMVTARIPRG